MRLPRLLLILTEFPPSFGGMQTHAVYLSRYLRERGYDITVATYRTPGDEQDVELPFPVHRILSRVAYQENLRLLTELAQRCGAELVYASTVFYGALRERTGLPVVCRSPGNDVLRPWIAWPYGPLSRVLSHPAVEDRLYARFRRLDWPERWERLLLRERRKAMVRAAVQHSRILANSGFTAGLLHELGMGDEGIRVVPGGVDAERFRPMGADRAMLRTRLGVPVSSYLLMTACRLVPKKGLHLLVETVGRLRTEMPDLHLMVVGDGRELSRCREMAAGLELAKAVTFTGPAPHERLREYYWAADQFVLASVEHVDPGTGLRDVETMGRVLCEANAAGTPVVASRSGGIPSVVEDGVNGLLFDEGQGEGLAGCVRRLRADGLLAERMVAEGLRRAREEFDWGRVLAAHEEEFRAAGRW